MGTVDFKRRAGTARVGVLRRIGDPLPVAVSTDRAGAPVRVSDRRVAAVREWWLVEDCWWTELPIRRHYWELVDTDGRVITVFREPGGSWKLHP